MVVIRRLAVFVFRIGFIAATVRAVDSLQFAGEGSADSTSLLSRNLSRFWLVIVAVCLTGFMSGSSAASEFRTDRVVARAGSAICGSIGDASKVSEAGEKSCGWGGVDAAAGAASTIGVSTGSDGAGESIGLRRVL